jgi:release factor glutamine methyltransferase
MIEYSMGQQYSPIQAHRQLLARSERLTKRYFYKICGHEIEIFPGVFSPAFADGTELFCRHFPYSQDDRFLEIGCGTGVTSVLAALAGAHSVVAVDINPLAVRNTRANAIRHKLSSVISTYVSDIFSNVPSQQRFSTIYWNMPFLYVPRRFKMKSMLERSIFDPGYCSNRRFFEECPKYLAKNGRVIVGFGDVGNIKALLANAATSGFTSKVIMAEEGESEPGVSASSKLHFVLFEMKLAAQSNNRI